MLEFIPHEKKVMKFPLPNGEVDLVEVLDLKLKMQSEQSAKDYAKQMMFYQILSLLMCQEELLRQSLSWAKDLALKKMMAYMLTMS